MGLTQGCGIKLYITYTELWQCIPFLGTSVAKQNYKKASILQQLWMARRLAPMGSSLPRYHEQLDEWSRTKKSLSKLTTITHNGTNFVSGIETCIKLSGIIDDF